MGLLDFLGSWFTPSAPAADPSASFQIADDFARAGADLPASYTAPPTPSGGSGFGDIASSIKSGFSGLSDVAKTALPVAQIGAAGMGLMSGIQGADQLAKQTKIAERAAGTQERLAAETAAAARPVSDFGASQLAAAKEGKIPEAIRAKIDEWKAAAKQQARDYLARSGQGDSSAMKLWEEYIDKQAVAMEAEALQGEMATGISASGTAGQMLGGAAGAASGAGRTAGGQADSLQNLIYAANQQLARLGASA